MAEEEKNSGGLVRTCWSHEDAIKAGVPQFYFNNAVVTLSSSDLLITIERNGAPVAIVNASFTTAKTLSIQIAECIKNLEEKTNIDIKTMEEIGKAYSND
ncbi:hypothetical protein [Candidatus Magnetominusculus xianensis]|uniref:Uncharacterized protein n=1 Tax=Candidatus Magnetominusculus xianensis TaxID=1748249 RepID=A0ABR5SHW1_9BACT|nr:hypothetical protein [Candidatus Magnetominusculus xianensis]KWT91822.1 hypothetical protein ASN18_0724 [Candidatus Magnetominusculus xianensis]MBF0403878.1 hypothetical protein [Nitrospirota bacterium]